MPPWHRTVEICLIYKINPYIQPNTNPMMDAMNKVPRTMINIHFTIFASFCGLEIVLFLKTSLITAMITKSRINAMTPISISQAMVYFSPNIEVNLPSLFTFIISFDENTLPFMQT